ncbi:MAG: hypothetical protein ACRC1F_01835 [Metamycoplasmataceae bacterium]
MTLNITQKDNMGTKEIIVSFAKELLLISENSEEWTNEGINKFLISLASKTPNDEDIVLEYDEKNEDTTYIHIVGLFKEFASEYNKTIKKQNSENI